MRLPKRQYSFETNSDFLGGIIIGVGITMLFCVICFGLYYLSNRGKKENTDDKDKDKKIKENFEYFDIDAHNREVDDIHYNNSNNFNNSNNSNNYEYYTPSQSQSMHDFGRIADDYFNQYILRE